MQSPAITAETAPGVVAGGQAVLHVSTCVLDTRLGSGVHTTKARGAKVDQQSADF
jgi:hypothetical protein